MPYDITRTELVWPGKYDDDGRRLEVDRVSLPFQVIERVNESRATREVTKAKGMTLFDVWEGDSAETFEDGWRNKLVWGDNKLVMSSLLDQFAGKINLIYIDPPFATGADFTFTAAIGESGQEIEKDQSIIEEMAYRDTWGAGIESYLAMMHARLTLMRDLLSERGSIYVHLDPTMSHYIKVILDEVFGADSFHSEIVWRRSNSHNKLSGQYGPIHDSILYYSKSSDYEFHPGTVPFSRGYIEARFVHQDHRGIYQPNYLTGPGTRSGASGRPWGGFDPTTKGRHWAIPSKLTALLEEKTSGLTPQEVLDKLLAADLLVIPKKAGGQPMYKQYVTEGIPYQDLWSYAPNSQRTVYGSDGCVDEDVKWLEQEAEKLSYATQKPEGLVRRILETSSTPGSLVADFFAGSGTTAAVAEKMGRRWIACDLGRFAVHTTRKRLLNLPGCRPFEVLNLGKYERKYWQVATFGEDLDHDGVISIYEYVSFILKLYGATPAAGMQHLHGKAGRAFVHVGAVDSPVTIDEIGACVEECVALRAKEVHILGWEWEMGLHDPMADEAAARGVQLVLRQIPREVMERQASAKGDVEFFELAYLDVEIKPTRKKLEVVARLNNFVIPNPELVPEKVRDKIGKWSDYVDYWAVDWNFSEDTFHQGWVTYRTRKDRSLDLESDTHDYERPGEYAVMVKVIDIFGNDTSKICKLKVG